MKTKIYCAKQSGKNQFYVSANGQEYYLFSENYRRVIGNFFSKPLMYGEAIDFSKAKGNFYVMNAMKKIPSCVRYIEKYYGIVLTNKGQKRANSEKYSRVYA